MKLYTKVIQKSIDASFSVVVVITLVALEKVEQFSFFSNCKFSLNIS